MDYDTGAIEQDYVESGHGYRTGSNEYDSSRGFIMDNEFMDYDIVVTDNGFD